MLRFGPFALDPQTGELRRNGEAVALAPQPAKLLVALASRPGELITREELHRSIWGGETFVDFERGLNFCVLQARTALGDDAKNPRFIETLPKRGYRFIAQPSGGQAILPVLTGRIARPPLLIVAAALIIIAIAAWQQRRADGTSALQTSVPAAHEAYLRGKAMRGEDAVRELREAVRLDPSFVLARVALAEGVHRLAMGERIPAAQAAAEIRAQSEAALRLAPDFAQSHAIAAMLHFWYEWNWDAADASYRRAIALNPNEPGALHDHGWLLITRGRTKEGIAEIRRAQALDPLSPRATMHVAWAYVYTRQFPEAIREARRAQELSPGLEEATMCIDIASGRPRPVEGKDSYSTAARLALSGDREGALRSLALAKEERNVSFVLAGVDPKLDALHGESRYVKMLADAGLRPITPPIR